MLNYLSQLFSFYPTMMYLLRPFISWYLNQIKFKSVEKLLRYLKGVLWRHVGTISAKKPIRLDIRRECRGVHTLRIWVMIHVIDNACCCRCVHLTNTMRKHCQTLFAGTIRLLTLPKWGDDVFVFPFKAKINEFIYI